MTQTPVRKVDKKFDKPTNIFRLYLVIPQLAVPQVSICYGY